MILNQINLNHLRLFTVVYRTRNMTQAALELHLTQSGISQHIKGLEKDLGVKLFDRIKQKLVPTEAAERMYQKCQQSMIQIEETLKEVKGVEKKYAGTVLIGLPFEFGNNCILPLLTHLLAEHPLLKFNIRYGYAYEMNQLILDGKIDFAFIDAFGLDSRICTERVFEEILFLCADKKGLEKKGFHDETKEGFESLEFIDYLKGEPVLRMWFKHHFPRLHIDLNVRVHVMGVQGVAKLILSGVGAGVLPGHHLAKLGKKQNKLYLFKGSGKPLKNTIAVAFLKEKSHSSTTLAVLKNIKERLNPQ